MPDSTRTAWDAEKMARMAERIVSGHKAPSVSELEDLAAFALDALRTLEEQDARLKELEAIIAKEPSK